MKNIFLALIMSFAVGAYAGLIQVSDDDRFQWIYFDQCAEYDSFTVGISINSDMNYAELVYQPTDSLCIPAMFNVVAPDRDSRDRIIPGDYSGNYRYYIDSWFGNNRISAIDTVEVTVNYTIPGGCNPLSALHID